VTRYFCDQCGQRLPRLGPYARYCSICGNRLFRDPALTSDKELAKPPGESGEVERLRRDVERLRQKGEVQRLLQERLRLEKEEKYLAESLESAGKVGAQQSEAERLRLDVEGLHLEAEIERLQQERLKLENERLEREKLALTESLESTRRVEKPYPEFGVERLRQEPRGSTTTVLKEASTAGWETTPEISFGALKAKRALTEALVRPVSVGTGIAEPAEAEAPEKLVGRIEQLEKEKESLRTQVWKSRKRPSVIASYGLAGIGALSLVSSVVFTSTVLAFIGLGLAFWGGLLLFIRPRKYVGLDVMDSTTLSSLATIDRVVTSLGYTQKGVYMPVSNPDKAVAFIPSQPLKEIPEIELAEKQTFVKDPEGIVVVPPGLALANHFERELGVKFTDWSLQQMSERLPRLLIEDLELVRDCTIDINGDHVTFKFVESVYSDFCAKLREDTKICGSLGCPMCSAMACVLAQVSHRPVEFDKHKYSPDGSTVESSYHILPG